MLYLLGGLIVGPLAVLATCRLVWMLTQGRYSVDGLQLRGHNIVITGTTSGIGKATAEALASTGANLWLLCRNSAEGDHSFSLKGLKRAVHCRTLGAGTVTVVHCDNASLASVKEAAKKVLEGCSEIHVLICNAGMGGYSGSGPQMTDDGFELVMQSNYFAHFLLTRLLLPNFVKGSRIVNVSSIMHRFTKRLPMEHLNFGAVEQYGFHGSQPYIFSKLAQILSTRELALRLRERDEALVNRRWLFEKPREGAATVLYAAVAPELEGISGTYFADCKPTEPSLLALNWNVARELWTESCRLLHLPPEIEDLK